MKEQSSGFSLYAKPFDLFLHAVMINENVVTLGLVQSGVFKYAEGGLCYGRI